MNRKKFITKCGYSWGDFAPSHAINPWLGCAFNCSYCWGRDRWWARMKGPLGKVWGVPKDFQWRIPVVFGGWEEAIERELLAERWPVDTRVLLCSMTDPYIPQEGQTGITRRILELLGQANLPTMILTKAALLPERDFDLLKSIDAWFGITMDQPFSHSNWHYARMTTLYQAHEEGIKTFVSLEPWIPGVDAIGMVRDMAEFVDHWIIGSLNYKGADKAFYRERLGPLIDFLDDNTPSYFIKPDLLRCLDGAIQQRDDGAP